MLCHFNFNNRVNNNKRTHELLKKKSFKPEMRKVLDFQLTFAEITHEGSRIFLLETEDNLIIKS